MKFNSLISGQILKRYKRFLADIKLDSGKTITAYVANTGSMKTCWKAGWPVLLSHHDNANRKLKYTLEMVFNGKTWIGINTSLTNRLAQEGIEKNIIAELTGYDRIRTEVKVEKSRLDILLEDKRKKQCFIEVKNVTLLGENKTAMFPDAVSSRGYKHITELINLKEQGHRAVALFIVQREDVDKFSPAKDIDSAFCNILKSAQSEGVELLAYKCSLSKTKIEISRRLEIYF